MQKYVFRNELKCGSLEELIRKRLEIHDLMNFNDLCLKTGLPQSELRPVLEVMLARGVIERLRPLEYDNDDMDFFRLAGPQRPADISAYRSRWFRRFQRAARQVFDNEQYSNNALTIS